MNNKDNDLLAGVYELLIEAKKKTEKLSPKAKKLAAAAEPFDKVTKADIITLANKKKTLKENVGQSLGNILSSYYHKGEGLDNETLHMVLSELEEIIAGVSNDQDPAAALDHLISRLRVD